MIRKAPCSTQRRVRQNEAGVVGPSPVAVAMVKAVGQSPPTPMAARVGAFLTNTVVCISRAMRLMWLTLL